MPSLFQVPQPSLGLMGRSRVQGRNRMPLIPGMELEGLLPPPADPIDEAMMARAAEQERQAAARRAQDEAVLASRPRERVSGMRLLDRVLGGQTITEGLDAERERLTAEANKSGGIERQRQILATITDPYERAIFLADPAKWSENAGYRLRPVTTAEGSVTSYGMGPNATRVAPPVIERFDDRFGIIDPLNTSAGTQYTAPRGMTAQEETARMVAETGSFNARNPVVAANARWLDETGGVRGEGYIAPDIQNVAPGGEALVFNNGALTGRVGSTQARPISDADQKAISEAETKLAVARTAQNRARSIIGQLNSGTLNLNPVSNAIAGIRNATGNSDANSLAYDDLMNWAKEARDAILAANTGVQTDQDAIRALDRILSSNGDERVVRQAINRFVESSSATSEVMQRDIARRQGGSAAASGVIAVSTPAEAAALPPGTRYRNPAGQEFTR